MEGAKVDVRKYAPCVGRRYWGHIGLLQSLLSNLYSLENEYENILLHFNFGQFDPLKQGLIFQKKQKNLKNIYQMIKKKIFS